MLNNFLIKIINHQHSSIHVLVNHYCPRHTSLKNKINRCPNTEHVLHFFTPTSSHSHNSFTPFCKYFVNVYRSTASAQQLHIRWLHHLLHYECIYFQGINACITHSSLPSLNKHGIEQSWPSFLCRLSVPHFNSVHISCLIFVGVVDYSSPNIHFCFSFCVFFIFYFFAGPQCSCCSCIEMFRID